MSVNRYKDHVLLVPEDEANERVANGFIMHHAVNFRAIAVEPPPGGWPVVLGQLEKVYIKYLRDWPNARVVLLIDFDEKEDRRAKFDLATPEDLQDRVFLIGCRDEAESVKRDLGRTFEQIGSALADECDTGNFTLWAGHHFGHNDTEVQRLALAVKPFLFP